MYEKFFGFTEQPFSMTPDPRYYFQTDTHREALKSLVYGITRKKGFLVLTGEVGTGKTTLCRALVANLGSQVDTALILNPDLSEVEILQAINRDLGLPCGTSKFELMESLNAFLVEKARQGGTVVIIIDDAQNLTQRALEQVRMISNFETDTEKLVQILLVGQPELNDILDKPENRQLKQRITQRAGLSFLSEPEVASYIAHRLSTAGAKDDLVRFTPKAVRRIFRETGGYPRSINVLADRVLMAAYKTAQREVDERLVRQESAGLRLRPSTWSRLAFHNRELAWSALGAAAAASLLGMFFVWRSFQLLPSQEASPTAAVAVLKTDIPQPPTAAPAGVMERTQQSGADADIEKNLAEARREAAIMRRQLSEKEDELRQLQQNRNVLQQKGASGDAAAQQELTAIQRRESELRSQLEAIKVESRNKAAEVDTMERTLENLRQRLSQVEKEKETLAKNLQAKDQILASLNGGAPSGSMETIEKLQAENQKLLENQKLMQSVASKTIEVQAAEIERLTKERSRLAETLEKNGLKDGSRSEEATAAVAP